MHKKHIVGALVLFFCAAVSWAHDGELHPVRVGVFQFEPLNFIDEDGKAQGLNPDLLREIALQQGHWRPEFIPVTWAEGLEKLETEELDLMVSVTYTQERTEFLDFTDSSVLELWSQVFVRSGANVLSTLDLRDWRVGIMKEGIHGKNFIKLAEAYGIDYGLTVFDTHQEIFEALERGVIDAGVVPNHFGLRHAHEYGLEETPIKFSPAPIHFATKKGTHADVLADIDSVLSAWKADKDSYYYWRHDYWFGIEHRWGSLVPLWLKVTFVVAVLTSLIFLGLSWWFRREVKSRTAKLSASEERYRLIVENQSELVVKVDREGYFLYVSPSYCTVFGKKESELLGKRFLPLVHEDDRAHTEREFNKIFTPPHVAYMEQRALTAAGWRWFSWQDTAILDEDGQVAEILGVGRDITEQKKAEFEVQQVNERLRMATKAGQVGVWEYDFKDDEMIWDDQMLAMYDLDRKCFMATLEAWHACVHPDDLNPMQREFNRSVMAHEGFDAEFRIVTRNLNVRHIRCLAESEYDRDGHPLRTIGMSWDVTPHRQMVAALSASERDYRQLFENMISGFFLLEVLDSSHGFPDDFKIIQVNEAVAKMASHDRHELIGLTLKELLEPLEREWMDVLSKVAMTGIPSSFESRMGALNLIVSAWIFVPRPGCLGMVITDTTARRTAEEAVRAAQLQLQHIFDNTSDVIFKTDHEGRFTYLNTAVEERTGYAIHELLGKNILDLVLPEKRDELEERLRVRNEGNHETGSFYFEMLSRDGRKLVLETVTTAVFDSEGELEAIHGIARDATERIQAERELEESRRFLRKIIDTIPARVFWKDRESVYLGCNAAFARDAGMEDPDQLVEMTDFDMSWAATEAERYREDDREIMEQGIERILFEEPQTRPDGTRCWLSTSKVPIRDAEGRVIGVLGAYQDITDKKELEEERIRLTTAIGQSAEAIVIMDIDGRIQYVNPAFESITGYTPGEAVGQTLALIKSGSRDAEFFSKIWKRLESGGSWEGRTENLRKNGSVYTAELAISPVKNPEGTMENYVAALRDVSRQVELEAHIRQAQKMDAVGRLAGGVAHDFNNILQSILGFSGILMGELETGTTQYEDVSEIRNAARRAGDLTRQLLTLSRKHDVEYAALDLNVIIRSNEAMLRRLIGEKIEFSFELEPELKRIRADSSQIEQILLNLFINARDAMPGGGRLKVKTSNVKPTDETPETVAGNGEQICLEVSDTGHGIREDVRAHLFEPFFTTKQVGEGTGLGLSVVYGIVQQHRGHIDVSSTVGEGSVFSVYLPVSGEDIVLQSGEEPEGQNERSVEGNGEEILVVEDDTVLRELSHRMLKDAGYSVESTASLKDAVEQEQQKMPDLVMADMVLPDGSGLDFARNLRERAPKLAVLLCSGYAHEQDIHEEIQQLGFRYLEKPIGSMQLLQTVREMLDELREV